jgi:hypothetical protein
VVRSAPWIATSSSIKRAASIAKAHGCSAAEVYAILAAHPIALDRDKFLPPTLALAFIGTAMGGERATLVGLNPGQGHAVQTIQHESLGAQTSTDQIRTAIDRIRGVA